jgi:hypothetical protein
LLVILFRLHSAGHLLDICLPKIGLGHLEPGKAYHFSDGYIIYKFSIPFMSTYLMYTSYETSVHDCVCKLQTLLCTWYFIVSRPWVEYKGVIPQNEMQNKQKELELEANALISTGGKVS